METISQDELFNSKRKYNQIISENIFIHPTEWGYALSCDATNTELVQKVREAKKAPLQPFSIIPPSKEWVLKNCKLNEAQKKYLNTLGKKVMIDDKEHIVTLVLELKNLHSIAPNVAPGLKTIGIKIPSHWFTEIVKDINKPLISTSANVKGDNFITDLDSLSADIKKVTKVAINDGEKKGIPTIVIQPHNYKERV